MDDERLKNPNYIFGYDYFEETLERIRNICSSERRFYQKIIDYILLTVQLEKIFKEKEIPTLIFALI